MTSKKTRNKPAEANKSRSDEEYILILHNDDVNSFEDVIDALTDVCKHDYEQALQCTFITHHKGRCDISKGRLETLKEMKNALILRKLKTTIDPL